MALGMTSPNANPAKRIRFRISICSLQLICGVECHVRDPQELRTNPMHTIEPGTRSAKVASSLPVVTVIDRRPQHSAASHSQLRGQCRPVRHGDIASSQMLVGPLSALKVRSGSECAFGVQYPVACKSWSLRSERGERVAGWLGKYRSPFSISLLLLPSVLDTRLWVCDMKVADAWVSFFVVFLRAYLIR